MTTSEFEVTGMHCGGCEGSVRDAVSAVDGVDVVEVSAVTGRLVVHSDQDILDALIVAAVEEVGYETVKTS